MFAVTEAGLLGVGPSNVIDGDAVTLLRGDDMPTILRKFDDAAYAFQGLAFINGIMEQELDGL